MDWQVVDSGVQQADKLMQRDAFLLEHLAQQSGPILHHYDWEKPSATFGYFVRPEGHVKKDALERGEIVFAKRPTGGGIVFHLWDLAFSVLVPATSAHFSSNTLENYAFVNRAVLAAVREWIGFEPILAAEQTPSMFPSASQFCMAQPSKYDVMFKGRKVAGAAQRKTRAGFLHQGTIALLMPDEACIRHVLIKGEQLAIAMRDNTFALLANGASMEDILCAKKQLRQLLHKHLIMR